MPTYEYVCETCGHTFEARQRFSDEPISKCPECGNCVRRILHAAGVIFKGSGFYLTDNRKAPEAAETGPEPKSEAPAMKEAPETTSTEAADD